MATATATRGQEHIGETEAMANHDHDLVHELSKRLDAVWRYDQYIANAEGRTELQAFWRKLKKQDQDCVNQIRELIKKEINVNCF